MAALKPTFLIISWLRFSGHLPKPCPIFMFLVDQDGNDPPTPSSSWMCSTIWATDPYWWNTIICGKRGIRTPLLRSPLRQFVKADEFYRLMPLSSHCVSTLCFCLDLCHLFLSIPQSMFLFMLIKSTQLLMTIASLTLVASKRLRLIRISFTGHQMLYFDCFIRTFATLLSL